MKKKRNNVSSKGPGRAYRKGLSIIELFQIFPNDKEAEEWFEAQRWPDGERFCPDCGSINYGQVKHKTMPYRCRDCRRYFSVRKGTVMEASSLSLQKWAIAMYMMTTGLKGTSSMKVHRELGITQKSAWFMMQRIREGFLENQGLPLPGPVEIDETFVGGKEKNKHAHKKLGPDHMHGKAVVVGIKDRETKKVRVEVVSDRSRETLQGFIEDHTDPASMKFTDDHAAYAGLPYHKAVSHTIGEWVDGLAHTNGIESFWAMLKRGYYGTFHRLSVKHLHRYVNEFAGRHNIRDKDTLEQMCLLATALVGKRLMYKDLVE